MKRRTFCGLMAGAGLAAATKFAAPALAGAPQVFRMGHLLTSDSNLGSGSRVFARAVAEGTNGRIRIEGYPGGSLGGDLEMFEALKLGSIDFGFITGGALSSLDPAFGVFDVPFLFRDARHAHAVLDGPIGADFLARFPKLGVTGLAWGENGIRHLTNAKRAIRTPEEARGLKIRVPQSEVMIAGFKELGMDVAPLAFPALFGALKSGQFDAQENPIGVIVSSRFDLVQKHITLTGHVYAVAVILMRADLARSLDPADLDVIRKAAVAGARESRRVAAEAERKGVDFLREKGMEVVADPDRAAFAKALEPLRPKFVERFGADLLERIAATRA